MLNRNFAIALAVAMVMAALIGCSSNNTGIKNDLSDAEEQVIMLQGDVTRLKGELMTAEGELMTAEGELMMSEGDVTRLEGELMTAEGDVTRLEGELMTAEGELMTAEGDVTRLEGELMTAEGDVTRLEGELMTAEGELMTAEGDVTRLEGELMTAEGDVTRLEGELMTAEGDVTRLEGELMTAEGDVTRLEGLLMTANSNTGTAEGQRDAAQRVSDLFAAAQNAIDDAATAADDAATAVESATEASGELTTLSVAGESATAAENAQAVLDADENADNAVVDANAAVESAKTALDDANALDADTANRASLISALTAAIEAAEASAEAAEESRGDDEGAIAIAVGVVEGDDEDMPMTPADHGEAVAMDIAMALAPTDGAGARVMHGTTAPDMTTDPMETAKDDNDHQGMTWEEIVGSANVIDTRIAEDTGTKGVEAASIAGMTAADVNNTLSPTGGDATDGMYDDGDQFLTSFSDGIPGIAFCGGNDCSVNADGDLMGSWYFTPTNDEESYVKLTANAVYTVEDLYVKFGHWLNSNSDGDTVINTYAMSDGNDTGLDLTTLNTVLTDKSATYEGTAMGMSVEKVTDTDGEVTDIDSAAFTATVVLNATFGGAPKLGGTVKGFVGDAADLNWEVVLLERDFVGSFDANDPGTTVTNSQDGEWTAQAYGVTGQRPTGIFGSFNAHFSDGHAAGAYATRK